jgi:DNA-3-methyladenine glycosylase I
MNASIRELTRVDGLIEGPDGKIRCAWHGNQDDYLAYHDREWGRPVGRYEAVREDLPGRLPVGPVLADDPAQAREFPRRFRRLRFRESCAVHGEADVERLVQDAGIIRHRGKIESTINNAKRALELRDEFGSLAAYFWSHEPPASERPARLDWARCGQCRRRPSRPPISKDLKKRGWSFVGPTTVYAFMQAMGLVNDHIEGCYCRPGGGSRARRLREAGVTAAQALFDNTARPDPRDGARDRGRRRLGGKPEMGRAELHAGQTAHRQFGAPRHPRRRDRGDAVHLPHPPGRPLPRALSRTASLYEGNRALVFKPGDAIPVAETKHCIAMALTYFRDRT